MTITHLRHYPSSLKLNSCGLIQRLENERQEIYGWFNQWSLAKKKWRWKKQRIDKISQALNFTSGHSGQWNYYKCSDRIMEDKLSITLLSAQRTLIYLELTLAMAFPTQEEGKVAASTTGTTRLISHIL